MVEIVEILRRSNQGITKPYICRGDDGKVYFVKGIGAGCKSLVSELIAGHLASHLELPIAPFEIVEVSSELVEIAGPLARDLGEGLAFGSLRQDMSELPFSAIEGVETNLQREIFAFDWWIMNGDRMLSESGGNPNIFLTPRDNQVVIIDHNLAFDLEASRREISEYHVFKDAGRDLLSDWELRTRFSRRFTESLECVSSILAKIPESWLYLDREMTTQSDFQPADAVRVLEMCRGPNFWDCQ